MPSQGQKSKIKETKSQQANLQGLPTMRHPHHQLLCQVKVKNPKSNIQNQNPKSRQGQFARTSHYKASSPPVVMTSQDLKSKV